MQNEINIQWKNGNRSWCRKSNRFMCIYNFTQDMIKVVVLVLFIVFRA